MNTIEQLQKRIKDEDAAVFAYKSMCDIEWVDADLEDVKNKEVCVTPFYSSIKGVANRDIEYQTMCEVFSKGKTVYEICHNSWEETILTIFIEDVENFVEDSQN